MVRTPNIRHSKGRREPVTIDLDPADVKREPGTAELPGAETKPARTPAAKPKPAPATPAEPAATVLPDPEQAEASAPSAAPETPAGASAAASTMAEPTMAEKGQSETVRSPAAAAADLLAADAEDPGEAVIGADRSSPDSVDPADPLPKAAAAEPKPVFGRDAYSASPSPTGPTVSPGPFRAAPPSPPRNGDAQGEAGASGRGRSRLSLVAAGVVGGIVVLVGAGALQFAGVLPVPGSAEPGEPTGLAELRSELAALRDQVAAGGAQADPAQAARLDDVTAALDQVRTDVDALRSAISQGEGGDAAGLQALDQRLAELETTVAALGGSGGAAAGGTIDLAPLTDRVGAIESRVAELSRTTQAASEAVSGLPDRIAALDQRLATLDGRVTELAAQLEEQASNPRIALAIAAAGLKAAIDRGDPFMTELETYASIAPDAPEIADLRALAASGVPTRAAISQDVNAAANRMIAAAAPVSDAGFFGRLLDSMQSVVKVRPIGDVEGDDVGAIVARLETAVRAGDYDRALAEYESLPEPARQAGAGFIADVKARQTADGLVERALSAALRPQEG
jgi:hypothetical protein